MADLLKDLYNQNFFDNLIKELKQITHIDEVRFLENTKNNQNWINLELKQRMKQISFALHTELGNNYINNVNILKKYIKILLGQENEQMNFLYMFLPHYIEEYGIDDFENSMSAIETITQFTSCEFAIRPFIIKYPQTMDYMLGWSKHQNSMVRRLASEGSRPRLPWGMALQEFKKNPTPVLPILENLINDENEIVRRSVANNLNDICKDNPNIAIEFGKKWVNNSEFANKVIRHGLRTLLKSGNQEALSLFGLEHKLNYEITNFNVKETEIDFGGKIEFEFIITNRSKEKSVYRIEYVIYYKKSNGQNNPKVFQIGEYLLSPNETQSFSKYQWLKDFTTRKHYAGEHKISIKVNGLETNSINFNLLK